MDHLHTQVMTGAGDDGIRDKISDEIIQSFLSRTGHFRHIRVGGYPERIKCAAIFDGLPSAPCPSIFLTSAKAVF